MVIRTLIAATVLLLVTSGQSFAQNVDHWRVAVQNAQIHPLADYGEGRMVIGRGRRTQQTFYVANYKTSQILLTVQLPHLIQAAAISSDGQWFIVSTQEHIYRIDMKDGIAQRLLEWVSGAVALDPSGQRLAVLGNLNVDLSAPNRGLPSKAKLGVYDLKRGQWFTQIDTPITSTPLVTFDGNHVIAAGLAGVVGGRASGSSYGWHCELDLRTAKPSFPRGTGEFGSTVPDVMPANSPPGSPEPAYEFPPPIKRLQASISSIYPDPRSNLNREKFTANGSRFIGHVVAMVANDQRLATFIVCNKNRSLLTILNTGEIGLEAVKTPSLPLNVYRDRILQQSSGRVTDVETGREITTFPPFHYYDLERWVRFVGSGWLVKDRDRLSYYTPGSSAPLWERESPENLGKFDLVASSRDGNRLFLCPWERKDAFHVLDTASGQTLMQPPFDPKSDSSIWVTQAAFNHDGSKLMVLYYTQSRGSNPAVVTYTRSIREYDVVSGQITFERLLRDNEHFQSLIHTGQKWLFSTRQGSLLVDEQTHREVKFPFGEIDLSCPITGRQDDALLVENTQYSKAIVTPAGQILRTWHVDNGSSSRKMLHPIPTSCVAFGGKVIARSTHECEIVLVDTQTLDTFANIHLIQLDQGFGWIAYTPDGYWDASPGVEKFVLVTKNGSVAQPVEVQSRRVPSLLQTRMPK